MKRNNEFDLLVEKSGSDGKVLVRASEDNWMLETKMWETFAGGNTSRERRSSPRKTYQDLKGWLRKKSEKTVTKTEQQKGKEKGDRNS